MSENLKSSDQVCLLRLIKSLRHPEEPYVPDEMYRKLELHKDKIGLDINNFAWCDASGCKLGYDLEGRSKSDNGQIIRMLGSCTPSYVTKD